MCDICVYTDCDTSESNYTYDFGTCYTNDTNLNGRTFLTGSEHFRVQEIEVFEITD
jgi:hypothetical protein